MEKPQPYENKGFELDQDISAKNVSHPKEDVKIKKWSIREKDVSKLRQKNNKKKFKSQFWNDLAQQKLKSHAPVFTPRTVIIIVLLTGLICISIGIILLLEVSRLKAHEFGVEYGSHTDEEWINLTINVKEDLAGDVYFYYLLENFPQIHSNFMRDAYLPAEAFIGYHSITDFDELCEVIRLCRGKWFDPPWLDMVFPNKSRIGRTIKNLKDTSNNYLPSFWPHANALRNYVWCQLPKCGQAQNSMFFDTFDVVGEDGIVPMTEDDINHAKERIAYKNPPNQHTPEQLKHYFNKCPIVNDSCPEWRYKIWELDLENEDNNGLQNAQYINWRRHSAYTTFRKLYKRLNKTGNYINGLRKGNYTVTIFNHFDFNKSASLEGKLKKWFVISGSSWLGMRSKFLPIAYLVVGTICIIATPILIFIHKRYGMTIEEMAKDLPGYYDYREPTSLNFY